MKRNLLLGVSLALGLFGLHSQVHADSYYRINLRAYRRMMHHQGPHPFSDRLWGIADNHVFQTGGPFDQLLAALLAQNLPNTSGDTTAAAAASEVVLDQNLVDADAKVRAMCRKLDIAYVEIPNAAQTNSVGARENSPTVNGSQVDASFYTPAPIPSDYSVPDVVPVKK